MSDTKRKHGSWFQADNEKLSLPEQRALLSAVALCAFVIYTNPTEPGLVSLQACNGQVLLPELRTHFALWVHSTQLFVPTAFVLVPRWATGSCRCRSSGRILHCGR